jgi:hypothetical protein
MGGCKAIGLNDAQQKKDGTITGAGSLTDCGTFRMCKGLLNA